RLHWCKSRFGGLRPQQSSRDRCRREGHCPAPNPCAASSLHSGNGASIMAWFAVRETNPLLRIGRLGMVTIALATSSSMASAAYYQTLLDDPYSQTNLTITPEGGLNRWTTEYSVTNTTGGTVNLGM